MDCPRADQTFGPRVDPGCRSFDLTLLFEDLFFASLPAALFIVLSPLNFVKTFRRRAGRSPRSVFLATKTGVLASFPLVNHQRASRSSTLLTLYLSSAVLLGSARVRTLPLLAAHSTISALMFVTFALTSIALLCESAERRTRLITNHNPEKGPQAPEGVSGFWIRTCFTWLASTFWRGYSRVISLDDLPPLDSELHSAKLGDILASKWTQYGKCGRYRLLRACFTSYFFSFTSPIVPRLSLTAFTFSQPLLINTTVTFVGYTNPDANYGKSLIGAWALVSLGIAASSSVYHYQTLRFVTRLRGGLIALAYQHALGRRDADVGEITAIALLGANVERMKVCMGLIHEVWGSLVDIGRASWLLGIQLSVATLAPIVLVLTFIATAQRRWTEKVQTRLRITTGLLSNMKSVKMSGLEQIIRNIMRAARVDEINTSSTFRKLLVATLTLSLVPINLAPAATFGIYVIISVFWEDGTLLPAKAFTSVLLQVVQCFASFDRIQEFCSYSEELGFAGLEHDLTQTEPENEPHDKVLSLQRNRNAAQLQQQNATISFSNESFTWCKESPPTLTNVNVELSPGTITAIVGPVGSGKSSFLFRARCQDDVKMKRITGGIAYCSQEFWLESMSIRQNIIGASPFDEKWYASVKALCCLDKDIAKLPRGDDTRIRSQGLNLSGGQKQRIALARAIYARHKVVVLDDVFSGMDAHTAEIKVIALSDKVIVLKEDSIVEITRPAVILQDEDNVVNSGVLLNSYSDAVSKESRYADGAESSSSADLSEPTPTKEDGATIEADESRKKADWTIYIYYLRNAGYPEIVCYAIAVVSWIFFIEFSTVWINWWSEANTVQGIQNVGYYIGIYTFLGVVGILGAAAAAWAIFTSVISNTGNKVHSHLLETTMSAPLRFFTDTDGGDLLNRFSQDLELIDMELPAAMVNYTSSVISVLGKVVVHAVFSQYHGIAIPFFGGAMYLLQRFYLQASRQVRLLDIEAKAPLYTLFSESVAGASTIRALAWQDDYQRRNNRHVDSSQRPMYLQGSLTVILIAVVVTWQDRFSPGSIGVSLTVVIGFSDTLLLAIVTWAKLESSLGALRRVKQFTDQTEREDGNDQNRDVPQGWPSAGIIAFEGVSASYRGSGKTSPILSLLRMVSVNQGNISIDNMDALVLRGSDLRRNIHTVPQDPVWIPRTIRDNVDPFHVALENSIVGAIRRIGLGSLLDAHGIDKVIDVTVLSTSQKQLLCFARAMIKTSKILVLDEAVSSVDVETEAMMQNIIDTEFKDCTVIAVAWMENGVPV
ncbi:ABC transporter [Xylariaceae sp. FL1272]|nr:ABC transporter [Xylariaceae sp. FL1272]